MKGKIMEDKKRLRRRCEQCKNVYDVARDTDTEWYDGFSDSGPVRVWWTSDSFNSEIYDDHTLMWLCGRCNYTSLMEI